MEARFGTDGVRGVANAELTVELALALGRAAARCLPAKTFVLGRDTRRSGPLLQAALAAGMAAEGADVLDLGVIPTPGVARASAERRLPGAMVSASHNPFWDNGIKLFDERGTKLVPEAEQVVEGELAALLADPGRPPARPTGRDVGVIASDGTGSSAYRRYLVDQLGGRRLEGLRIVVDCANGAAARFAPDVLERLGAAVTPIACEPDGLNINEQCGSTHPAVLARRVVADGADLGLAVDGDADRLVAVDGRGRLVDGDVLLALFALDLAAQGLLVGNKVVVTVMTNLGFRLAMAERGVAVHETPVGDRHVLAALDAEGLALGGEQSGHIVFRQRSTTGDGVLTAVLLADLVARSGRPLDELASGLVERVPQVLVNVPVRSPEDLADAADVWKAVSEAELELGDRGRVVLRPSGTEPLVRVMVEAGTEQLAASTADRLCAVVRDALGAAGA